MRWFYRFHSLIQALLPGLLLLVWLAGKGWFQNRQWLWLWYLIPAFLSAVYILLVLWKERRRRKAGESQQVHRLSSSMLKMMTFLMTAEATVSLPLLLAAIGVIGAMGDALSGGNIYLSLSFAAWLVVIATAMLWLEEPYEIHQPGVPVQTKGLALFMSKQFHGDKANRGWHILQGYTPHLDAHDCPSWQEIRERMPELMRQHREDRALPIPSPEGSLTEAWLHALAASNLGPTVYALAYHVPKLRHVWPIATEDSEDTRHLFEKIVQALNKNHGAQSKTHIDLHETPLLTNSDCNNVERVRQYVESLYEEVTHLMIIPEHELTTDVTGGTKTMGIGGVLTCVQGGRPVQYLDQNNYQLQSIPLSFDTIAPAVMTLLNQANAYMLARQNRNVE